MKSNLVCVFIYYFLFIRKTKRDYKIPSEAQYLIALYKLDTKLFSYQRFVRIVGMVTSFDIALVATMVANIDGSIWQILFGFVIVVPVMVISFMLLGKFYQKKEIKDMSLKDAIIIGCSQVFALIPGFSRSGTTIAAGRAIKLNREDSAKFSFFLSAPVVLGAVLVHVIKDGTIDLIMANLSMFIVGVLSSFIIGLLCINFLLKYLKKNDFKLFMWYRIILGIIVIFWTIFK